jgi:hypothetical protein
LDTLIGIFKFVSVITPIEWDKGRDEQGLEESNEVTPDNSGNNNVLPPVREGHEAPRDIPVNLEENMVIEIADHNESVIPSLIGLPYPMY